MKKTSLVVLSGVLLLASCGGGQQTPAPEAKKPGAVYQLDFSLDATTQASASVHKAGSAISGQSLENTPDPVTINTRSVTTTTFVAKQNGVDMRHLSTTLEVTNNTGQTLKNLAVLPVMRQDADGDASNNAATPTIGNTPFMNVRLFDGSDADAQASAMQTVQGKNVDLKTGEVFLNPQASPYLTGLDVSALTAPAPAGMTATVMNTGWLTASTLAPGETAHVTIAIDIPVDRANPKTQPFSFSMLVTSAQDVSGSEVGVSNPAHLQGVLQNWNFGADKRLINTVNTASGPKSQDLSDIAASGAVDTTLPTPTIQDLRPLFNQSCVFTGTQTAGNINVSFLQLSAVSKEGDLLGTVKEKTSGGQTVFRVYSDTTAQFRGQASNCNLTPAVDLNMVRGWNLLTVADVNGTPTLQTLTLGSNTQLFFEKAADSLGIFFTDSSPMTLRANQAGVTRAVKLLQNGGISGDVTFETDVPGVTVKPSPLSVPPLSAASTSTAISAQALDTSLTFTADDSAQTYSGFMNVYAKKGGVVVGQGTLYTSVIVPKFYIGLDTKYTMGAQMPELPQGSTVTVPFTVSSMNDFSGPVTLTLKGLPAGVTATSPTLTVQPGQATPGSFELTATASADLGAFTATISSPKLDTSMPSTIRMQVVPAQVTLPVTSIQSVAPSQQGLWVLGNTSGGQSLLLVKGNQIARQVAVSTGYTYKLVPTLGGDVYLAESNLASNGTPSATLTLFKGTGEKTVYNVAGDYSYSFVSGVSDSAGNYWFIDNTSGSEHGLKRLTPTTGTVETVVSLGSATGDNLRISPDGTKLSYGTSGNIQVYDITSKTQTSLGSMSASNLNSFQPFLVDNAGNVTGVNYSGNPVQVTPAGSTTLSNDYLASLYGLDYANPSLLWTSSGSALSQFNIPARTLTQKPFTGQVNTATPDLSGGLWMTVQKYDNSGNSSYYASFLK